MPVAIYVSIAILMIMIFLQNNPEFILIIVRWLVKQLLKGLILDGADMEEAISIVKEKTPGLPLGKYELELLYEEAEAEVDEEYGDDEYTEPEK
jgi:hypothetical protein